MTQFLTRAEVCAMIGVSYPTLWERIRKGQFPAGYVLWNRQVRWKADEVEAWLAACTSGPTAKKQALLGMPGHKPLGGRKRGRKPHSASA